MLKAVKAGTPRVRLQWRAYLAAVLGSCAFLPAVYAQNSDTTVPVGFVRVTIPAAASASNPTLATLSVPFYSTALYASSVSALNGVNACSLTNAAFTANQFTANPTYLRIKSGANTGRAFLITANTTTQVTLATGVYSLVTGTPASPTQLQLQAGDKVEILAANTLGSVFGTSSVPLQTGASAAQADNVLFFNGTTWVAYFHDGTSWKTSGSQVVQNNAVIAPESAVFVVRRALSAVDVFVAGTVSSTQERSDITGPGARFFSNRFPVDTTLAGLALQAMANWGAGASASAGDSALLWTGSTWDSFYYNGSHWRKAGSLLDADSQTVPAGGGLFISRKSSASGSTATVSSPLPYSL